MSDYVLLSDATSDLPASVIEELGIQIVPMEFIMDDKTYHFEPTEKEITCAQFYQFLREGKLSSTTQINPSIYEEIFGDILARGKDIFYLAFTSGLSGTYQSAQIAKEMLLEEYPERKIVVVDSLCASIGEGILLYHTAKQKNSGLSIEELEVWVNEHRQEVANWFTVEDLFHLNRGGRLSAVEAVVGSALKIKPVISVDEKGKLVVMAKVRGMRKGLEYLISRLEEEAKDLPKQTVIIGHGDSIEVAKQLETMLREKDLVEDVIINHIGPIIGTHVGPGMIALVFMKKM